MLRSIILLATALVILADVSIQRTANSADVSWNGWRGPGRDGWVKDFRPPSSWPERLEQVWKVEVGTGYASPLVADGRVYQFARQGEEEIVQCLDLDSGAVKWRKSYAAPFKMGGGGEAHGKGPKSSPALADGRLFTLSITGLLSAWDADSGELLWRKNYASQFEKNHPYWGASTSPLVDGNRLIVHLGSDDRGKLLALDVKSGKEVWTQGKHGPAYASPILVEIQGVRQVIELNMQTLAGIDSQSGRLLWEYDYPQIKTDQNMVTPVYHDRIVLLGGENRGIYGLELRLEDGTWKVHERWHQKQVALDMSSAVVNGDLLYGFSHYGQGRLFCLDIKTGDVRWQGPGRTGENVMFLSIPGHIVALVDTGELKIVAADGERFNPVASYRVAENATWAPPVLLPSGFLVKDLETLTLWSLGEPPAQASANSRQRQR